jgi:serine/threonine-protein phosphatase 6 regulatory ankyrin repeat subunit B
LDGVVDEPDDGMCLSKKDCKGSSNNSDIKLLKCSHCGAKTWNILGDSNTGYAFTTDDGKNCLLRDSKTNKAVTVPCGADAAAAGSTTTTDQQYTPFQLQFASATDIQQMSSPGARLVGAASDGDKKAIQAMLKEGIDVNFRDWDQLTALIPASSSGNLDLVKFLIKEKIDVNAQDKDGITALMEASIMGHAKVVDFLIQSGADVTAAANSGVTSLWLAASAGKSDCIQLLVSKGADVNNERNDGITALMTASVGGHVDAVKLLLEKGADATATDKDGVTPLMNAAEAGAVEVVKTMVQKTPEDDRKSYMDTVSTTGFTAIIIASAQGHKEVVEYLINAGAGADVVGENGVNALMYAAANNHVEVMRVLLDKGGANIEAKHTNGGTALLEATTSGAADAMKLLIEKGAAVDLQDDDGVTPLMATGSQKKAEGHKVILDALKANYSGQDLTNHINLFSYSGGSAVMFAAAAGNTELVEELMGLGAEVKAVAKATPEYMKKLEKMIAEGQVTNEEPHVDGLTALHVAAQGGHLTTAEVLLKAGVEVNIDDEEGRSPLILAIKGNFGELASILVRAGANPNTPFTDDKGVKHNLLFDAIMVENEKFATALIEGGADIYHKDEKKVSTLLQACHRGLSDIAKLLLDKHKANGKAGYIDDASDEGISPLIAASSEGHVEIVKLLLTGGVNINAVDKDGTNSLMAAAARGHLPIVKELLDAGAKLNEQNTDGHTALMFAYNGKNQVETLWERFNQFSKEQDSKEDAGTGKIIKEALDSHMALVDLLLKKGADTKLKDKEGHTAQDFDYHPDTDAELLEKEKLAEKARRESKDEL